MGAFVLGVGMCGISHAQTSADVFEALESVYSDQMTSAYAQKAVEDGATLWRFALEGGSSGYTVDGDAARTAGHIRIDIASASQWSALRKALVSEIGSGNKQRGNTVLLWEVTEPSSQFASTARVVLSKSGSEAMFSFERRKPVSESGGLIADTAPQAPSSSSSLSLTASRQVIKQRDD